MRDVPWLLIGFVGTGLGSVAIALYSLMPTLRRRRRFASTRLTGAFLEALGALGLVTGLLLRDGGTDEADALRTGGLAAASVVALYGLWLNDRRRRTSEGQHELDRERAADDRFAKAVELLGHDADQVRVGAMHALAGLAKSRPDYAQTVLDILCAYLRRPFDGVDENERQVRLTAQRLIKDLLPMKQPPGSTPYSLDLTGARLEYFDLSMKVVGELRLRSAELRNSVNFSYSSFIGPVWLTGATFNLVEHGNSFRCVETEFGFSAWFSKVRSTMPVDFTRAEFHYETKFADAVFEKPVTFDDATFADAPDFSHTTFQAGKPTLSAEQLGQGALPG